MRFRLAFDRARVLAALPRVGLVLFAIAVLVCVAVSRESRVLFALGIAIVLARFMCGVIYSTVLTVVLVVASVLLVFEVSSAGVSEPWPMVFFVPAYLVVAWGVVFYASQGYQQETLKLHLAQEQEGEAASELTEVLEDERVRIAGSRQRIEKILMLMDVTNDLSSTLELKGVMEYTLSWTKELAGQMGTPKIVLFDEHGGRVYRIESGSLVVARETPDAISMWIRERKTPLLVADVSRDQRLRGMGVETAGARSLIATPLIRGKSVMGVLQVHSSEVETFTAEDWRLISLLSDLTSVAIQNAQLYQQTQKEAITDGLTELFVHRYFRERLLEEVKRVRENGGTLILLMIDIDNFKSFNDTYGHLVGDAVLKGVSQILRDGVRGTDLVARYGGEEFAVLLVETSQEPGVIVADRLRASVAAASYEGIETEKPVTVSVGLACFPDHGMDERGLIEAADVALYAAKRTGKNRVVVAEKKS